MPLNTLEIAKKENDTIKIVNDIFRGKGKWSEKTEYNIQRFELLFRTLNTIWNTQTNIKIDFFNNHAYAETGGGKFSSTNNTLYLFFPSVMTALHEWKHCLQFHYPEYTKFPDIEEDAQKWSHTIFKRVFPKLYEKNISSGKFFHTPLEMFPLEIDKPEIRIALSTETTNREENLRREVENSVYSTLSEIANNLLNPSAQAPRSQNKEIQEISNELSETIDRQTRAIFKKKQK